MTSKTFIDDEHMDARPLDDSQLASIAGGGAPRGPICPICGSTNVQIARPAGSRPYVKSCNDCDYSA